MIKAVNVTVSGRVQGVGFRAFTRKNAAMLGVKGYVENMDDGRVHAVIEGDAHQVDKLLELLRHGPAGSQVRDVKALDIAVSGLKGFDIRC